MKSNIKILIISCIGLLAIFFIYSKFTKETPQISKSSKEIISLEKDSNLNESEYKSYPIKNVGLNYQKKATQKIMILTDKTPSDQSLIGTAKNIWNKNKQFEEFTIFIYLEGMDINKTAYSYLEISNNGLNFNYKNMRTEDDGDYSKFNWKKHSWDSPTDSSFLKGKWKSLDIDIITITIKSASNGTLRWNDGPNQLMKIYNPGFDYSKFEIKTFIGSTETRSFIVFKSLDTQKDYLRLVDKFDNISVYYRVN
jgi:hypothetical protein